MAELNRFIIRIVVCVAFVFTWIGASGQDTQDDLDRYLDSLTSLLNGLPDGMDRLKILDELSKEHYNVDSVYKYATEQLELARTLNDNYYLANAQRFLGWYYYQVDEFEQSANCYFDGIHLCQSISDDYVLAMCYYGLANSKSELGDDSVADEYLLKALDLFKSLEMDERVSEIYRKLAYIRVDYHIYESANDYVSKAFALDSLRGDISSLANDYYMLGWIFYKRYADIEMPYFLSSAKENMIKGYELANAYNSSLNVFWISREIMFLFQDIAKTQTGEERALSLDSAYYFYKVTDSLMNFCSIGKQNIYLDFWRAKSLAIDGKFNQSLELLKEIEQRPKLTGDNKLYLYRSLIFVYESSGDYANALKYTKLQYRVDKETYNRDFGVRATSVEKERELSQLKLKQQKQLYTIVIVSLCFVMVSILALVILHGFLRNRKLNARLALQNDEIVRKNAELNERNAEILAQRDEIEVQRDNIEITTQMLMDSINYAKHIQDAVMISHESMHRIFGDTLIYWRPMNVVSGDFYWAMQKGNFKMLVLADCTGHGVPGAFMSMFAISSLNSIVSPLNFENIKASDVLDMLRAKVIGELHQTSTSGDSIESVDMALCIIDTNKMQVQYAGANRPLLIARDGNIIVYKPDKMPVGLHIIRKDPFVNNVIDLKKNDVLYMYTDGITDQFGSEDDDVASGKYTAKRLDNLLQGIVGKPFAEQAGIIDRTLIDWRTMPNKTMIDQYDDQLLLGVRIG